MVYWLEQSLRNHQQKDSYEPSLGQRQDNAMFYQAVPVLNTYDIQSLFINEFP